MVSALAVYLITLTFLQWRLLSNAAFFRHFIYTLYWTRRHVQPKNYPKFSLIMVCVLQGSCSEMSLLESLISPQLLQWFILESWVHMIFCRSPIVISRLMCKQKKYSAVYTKWFGDNITSSGLECQSCVILQTQITLPIFQRYIGLHLFSAKERYLLPIWALLFFWRTAGSGV